MGVGRREGKTAGKTAGKREGKRVGKRVGKTARERKKEREREEDGVREGVRQWGGDFASRGMRRFLLDMLDGGEMKKMDGCMDGWVVDRELMGSWLLLWLAGSMWEMASFVCVREKEEMMGEVIEWVRKNLLMVLIEDEKVKLGILDSKRRKEEGGKGRGNGKRLCCFSAVL